MNSSQYKSNKYDIKKANISKNCSLRFVILSIVALILSACASEPRNNYPSPVSSNQSAQPTQTPYSNQANYVCQQPANFVGQVIGDGHCVSLIKFCSNAPQTTLWSPGKKVLSLPKDSIKPGSIIATFENGVYPSVTGYHAAIYIEHDERGIWVWDQWIGKPVHKRLIRTRYDNATASNTAQAYRLVK